MCKKIPAIIFIAIILVVSQVLILPCVPAHAGEDESECWAVIIGISDYKVLDDIRGCANDAEALSQVLKPIWGEEYVKLLVNSNAAKDEIEEAIEWLISNADTNDTVLIYFGGYSDEEDLIAPYDAKYKETWISSGELSRWLQELKSEKVVIVLNTSMAAIFNEKLKESGRVILSSSRADEHSYSFKHELLGWLSYFSYSLHEAIFRFQAYGGVISFEYDTNRDYELTAEELFRYAEPTTVEKTGGKQHPVLSDNYPGELSLLVKCVLKIEPQLPTDNNIFSLDDEQYSSTPLKFTWAPGFVHDLSILLPLLDTGKGTRYIFTSWSDGDTSDKRTISHGGEYTAIYKTQHELIIDSLYSEPKGQGWHDEGSTAEISVKSIEEPTIKHIFTGWSGDYSGTEATVPIDVDSPMTITANWRTDYLLTIESPYGEPRGQGWYEAGSTASIALTPIEGQLIRQVFTGWSGDYSGTEATVPIDVDSPMTITANWRTDYTYLYIAIASLAVGLAILVAIIITIVIRIRRKKKTT